MSERQRDSAVLTRLLSKEEPFDWYLRADDDAYVLVDNLRAFLKGYNATEEHYLGFKWNFFTVG